MKKRNVILFLLVLFSGVFASAESIKVLKPKIYDSSLKKISDTILEYALEDNIYIKGGTFFLGFSEELIGSRILLLGADFIEKLNFTIEKAQKWKVVAIENNINELSKNIFEKEIDVPAFTSFGSYTANPSPLFIRFNFQIIKNEYWLILFYRDIKAVNSRRRGSPLYFKVDSDLEKLKIAISESKIKEYKEQILKKQQEKELFN